MLHLQDVPAISASSILPAIMALLLLLLLGWASISTACRASAGWAGLGAGPALIVAAMTRRLASLADHVSQVS